MGPLVGRRLVASGNAPRLTVALIVRDCERQLAATLQSVQSIADEMVVADTGSSDGTLDVARKYHANTVQVTWFDDFAAARNRCCDQAAGDWILWLDADERLSESAATALREFLHHQADARQAYCLSIRIPPLGSQLDSEQRVALRLLPNGKQTRFLGRVRETAIHSVFEQGLAVQRLPICVERSTHHHDPGVKRLRATRNIRLAELEIREQGPQPRLLNCLAEALEVLHERDRAEEYYRRAIVASRRGSTDMLEAYYGLLSMNDSHNEQQIALCTEALQIFPRDCQLLCAMGSYLQEVRRLDLALRSYQSAYQHGQIDPELWHLSSTHEVAGLCYALALELEGRPKEAVDVLQDLLRRYPDSARGRQHLNKLRHRPAPLIVPAPRTTVGNRSQAATG